MSTAYILLAIAIGVFLVRLEYKRTLDKQAHLAQSIEPDEEIHVNFLKSGRHVPWDPNCGNLLEFASAQGIPTESLCRQGQCGTCQTTLLQGEVIYQLPPEFEIESGKCLLCIGSPKTSVSLEL